MLNLTTVTFNDLDNFSDEAILVAISEYVKTKPAIFSSWAYDRGLHVVNYKIQDHLYLQILESTMADDLGHIFEWAFTLDRPTDTMVSYEYDDGDLVIDE